MKLVTTRNVEKLLRSLNNDPRLQALDDSTLLSEEQYPVAFDALIMRIRDPITLTTTVDTLNYNDTGTQAQSIPSAMRSQLKEKQVKLREILQLNPTVDNPLDELTYSHWIHRVTNICLDAAQMALMPVDTSPGMQYLFAPSSEADNTVRRGDKRNVEGQLLYHTMLLNSPWELPGDCQQKVLDLIAEKDPYTVTKSQPDPYYPIDNWGEEYFSRDRLKALQSIEIAKTSIVVLLNRIHKFTSHTFHVLIRELIPGAKEDKSNLFTMIKEHRNQYMITSREAGGTVPYTAKNTLDFIRDKFVKTNANTAHIAWTKMLLHTRDIGQGIYQWQASFDPLVRRFEQARTRKLKRSHLTSLKQLVAKQITDNEKIVLSGISPKYSIDKIDKGKFIIKEFQDDLALNTARFKGYTPDARIIAHLRTRAKEFNVDVPIFLRRKQQDQRDPLGKRKFKRFPHYLNEETATEDQEDPQEEHTQLYMSKGKGKKGKGKKGLKGDKGGYRSQQPRPHLAFDNSKGKGKKGKPPFPGSKGKGKTPSSYGNRGKDNSPSWMKNNTSPTLTSEANTSSGVSSYTSIVCGFCHKIGHTTENCRKRTALHSNTLYQQTRSKFSGRQQLLFEGLENSVFSPDACSWCLQSHCDGRSCTPPEEPVFFTQTNNAFCEEILPLVKNAKLELPVGSNEPLSPQQFHFQDSYWGDDHSYPYDQYADESAYIYDINYDNEYNQYHYPQEYKGDGEYPSYNYEGDSWEPSLQNKEDVSVEYEETNEGLLCEEDETDTVFDDGLEQ